MGSRHTGSKRTASESVAAAQIQRAKDDPPKKSSPRAPADDDDDHDERFVGEGFEERCGKGGDLSGHFLLRKYAKRE